MPLAPPYIELDTASEPLYHHLRRVLQHTSCLAPSLESWFQQHSLCSHYSWKIENLPFLQVPHIHVMIMFDLS